MTGKRKLEGEAEVRASAGDVIHDIVKSKPHHVSHAASHFIHGVDLHEGDHGQVGSKCLWTYTLEGKKMVAKSVIEEIDEEKKYVKYRVIEGDMLKDLKNFTGALQVIPKDSETCIAKVMFEYEKIDSSSPEPTNLMNSWIEACYRLDDHHHGIKK